MHVEVVLPLGYAYKRQAMIGKSHDASMVRALFFCCFFTRTVRGISCDQSSSIHDWTGAEPRYHYYLSGQRKHLHSWTLPAWERKEAAAGRGWEELNDNYVFFFLSNVTKKCNRTSSGMGIAIGNLILLDVHSTPTPHRILESKGARACR